MAMAKKQQETPQVQEESAEQQETPQVQSEPVVLIDVEFNSWSTTSLHGKFAPGDKGKIPVDFAVQLEKEGTLKCLPDESNKEEYEKEISK